MALFDFSRAWQRRQAPMMRLLLLAEPPAQKGWPAAMPAMPMIAIQHRNASRRDFGKEYNSNRYPIRQTLLATPQSITHPPTTAPLAPPAHTKKLRALRLRKGALAC